MSQSLRILPQALEDVEEIADYLGARTLDGMLRWLDAYEQAFATSNRNP